jgi:hypothetical protein
LANAKTAIGQIYPEISGVIKKKILKMSTRNQHDALITEQTSRL